MLYCFMFDRFTISLVISCMNTMFLSVLKLCWFKKMGIPGYKLLLAFLGFCLLIQSNFLLKYFAYICIFLKCWINKLDWLLQSYHFAKWIYSPVNIWPFTKTRVIQASETKQAETERRRDLVDWARRVSERQWDGRWR